MLTTVRLMIPYVIGAAVYMLARHAALQRPLPRASIAIKPQFTLVNLWSAPEAFCWYLKKLVFPSSLSILHDSITVQQFSARGFLLPLFVLVLITAAVIWAWRKTHSWQLLFLAAWFVLTLAPAVAMSPLVTVHDRYLQLAVYPFCALLVYAISWLARNHGRQWAAVGIALVFIAAWSVSTWHESGFWDNSMSLWTRAVQVAPHNINARFELARLHAVNDVPTAIRVLDDGLRYVPASPGLWRTRGLLLFNAGRLEESRASLMKTLEVSARFAVTQQEPTDVKYGRADAAFYLGEIEMLEGRPDSADPWLRMALSINPENVDYNTVMIANLKRRGLKDEAAKLEDDFDRNIAASNTKRTQ